MYYQYARSQLLEVLVAEVVGHAVLVLANDGPVVFLRGGVVPGGGVEANAGSDLCFLQIFIDCLQDVVEVLPVVVVLGWLDIEVDLVGVFTVEVVEVVLLRNFVFDLPAHHQPRFVGPATSHVLDCVPSAPQQDHRSAETLHVGEQFSVSADGEVEVAKFIAGEGVCAALDDHDVRDVEGADAAHDLFEELDVGEIVHALPEGDVGSEELAYSLAHFLQGASAREEILLEFVEADGEDAVGVEEGLLDPIAVVHIDVQVQHSGIYLQQLQDAQHDIVDIAESTRLCFLGMVISSRPVYHNIPLPRNHQVRSVDAPSRRQPAEVVQPLEARTIHGLVDLEDGVEFGIVPHLDLLLLGGGVLFYNLFCSRGDPGLEVLDVVRVMEGSDLL